MLGNNDTKANLVEDDLAVLKEKEVKFVLQHKNHKWKAFISVNKDK